jgi:hypothetical protein
MILIILLVGKPPQWRQPVLPLRLPPDEGIRFVDHTGAQVEKLGVSRLQPMFQVIEHCTPDFDYKSLDLVCNRNNMRNLLRWILESTEKDFRIDLYLTNGQKTIVMLEHELENTETVPAGTFRGFGDNFRKATAIPPPGQSRHNRVVNYVSYIAVLVNRSAY